MNYFSNFNTIPYDINGDGIFDNVVNLTNIVKITDKLSDDISLYNLVTINSGERPDQLSYRLYGSTKYYWTFLLTNPNIKNFWNDWPKTDTQLIEYVVTKHKGLAATTDMSLTNKFKIGEQVQGVISGAIGTVYEIHNNLGYVHILPVSGDFKEDGEDIYGLDSQDVVTAEFIKNIGYAPKYHIDNATGEMTTKRLAGTSPVSILDYERNHNNRNIHLKVIKPEHIQNIFEEFTIEISK